MVRKALIGSVGIGMLLFLVSGCLFDQQSQSPPAQPPSGPVIPIINNDNSVFWVVIVLLVVGCFVLMRNWSRQEARADMAELEARLLAAQRAQAPMLEQRPVLNGYPVGYEYRQIGR